MSVDFHVEKRAAIPIAAFKSSLRGLLGQILPEDRDTPIEISPHKPGSTADMETLGNVTSAYRVDLVGKEAVLLFYLGRESVHKEVYLVGLDVGQPAANVVWAILVAEALCALGGNGIDDEGFVSHHDGPLAAGQLLSILLNSENGKRLLEAARHKFWGTSHMLQVAQGLKAVVEQACIKLRGLDAATVSHRPSPDRWTIKEVIGHLIDSCANNHQRFIRAQFTTELAFPKYEQNQWVSAQHYDQIEWTDLLELWRRYNLHLAHVISHINPAALNTRCTIGDYPPMTLQLLVEDYVVHVKHHLSKIDERLKF